MKGVSVQRFLNWRLFHPDFPISPQKSPIFYGWVILATSVLGIVASIPGQTIGVSVFTDHLLTATGLSRLQLSNAYLIGTLVSGLLLPLGGKLLDRLGARLVIVLAAWGLGITLLYLSACDRLVGRVVDLMPAWHEGLAMLLLGLGFISLRFCGQGMLTMTSRATLGKWFDRRRGQMSGIAGIFVSFGFAIAPLGLSYWIGLWGWRQAWVSLAIVIAVGMGLGGWLLVRDNPEACGLAMDGGGSTAVGEPLQGHTRREALSTLAFWGLSLAFGSQAMSITGITFHIVAIGAEAGLSEIQTVSIFLPIAVVSTSVGYLIGLASDRAPISRLIVGMMLAQITGILGMAHLALEVSRWLAVVGLGISGGCFGTLSTVALPRFFGRAHLGAIAGVQMMIIVIASALGPSLLAAFRQGWGSYAPGLYLCCALPLLVVGMMQFIEDHARPPANR